MIGELPVNRIGLGTNKITDTPEAAGLLQYAVQAGVNFIDTAYVYTDGDSETAIGNTLAPYPEDVVIATKGGYIDNRPDFLRANLMESLRRLQTQRITLYQLHRLIPGVSIKKTMETLKSFEDEGLVQYVGLSEVTADQIDEASQYVRVVSVQNEYSLAERKHDGAVDYCTENGIAFIPWFPLRHITAEQQSMLAEVGANHQATPEQVALAWLLKRSPRMLPIPGTLSKQHLKENIQAAAIDLTDAEYERLSDLA
jgi:aryl-alcohol dehydrogenase-like predicted oxidoreductase